MYLPWKGEWICVTLLLLVLTDLQNWCKSGSGLALYPGSEQ